MAGAVPATTAPSRQYGACTKNEPTRTPGADAVPRMSGAGGSYQVPPSFDHWQRNSAVAPALTLATCTMNATQPWVKETSRPASAMVVVRVKFPNKGITFATAGLSSCPGWGLENIDVFASQTGKRGLRLLIGGPNRGNLGVRENGHQDVRCWRGHKVTGQ